MHLYTCAQDDCLCKSTKPSANHIGQLPIGSPTANQASTFRKWKPASPFWVSVTAPAPHPPRRITASGNTHHHYHHQYYHCYCWQSYLDPQLTRYHNRGVNHAMGTSDWPLLRQEIRQQTRPSYSPGLVYQRMASSRGWHS